MKHSFSTGSIVVGTDGSAGSDVAVVWAAEYAATQRRSLAIVHGTGYPVVIAQFGVQVTEAREATQSAGQQVVDLSVALAERSSPGLLVTGEVAAVEPRQLLTEMAAEGSMLVLGARGHGPIASLLLGSVSSALVAGLHCPVVIARAPSEAVDGAPLPIVVGVDGTAASIRAIDLAFDTASWQGRPLEVVHALGVSNSYSYLDLPTDKQVHRLRVECELMIAESLAGHTEKFPDVAVSTIISPESPARALRAASTSASAVVVGSRGRGPVARRVLGSVSRSIVERADCTVIVVPADES